MSLSRITFLSFEEKIILEKNLDSSATLALMSKDDISLLIKRDLKRAVWNGNENLRRAQIAKHYCDVFKIDILLYSDLKYPELLRNTYNPPYLLFYKGDVNCLCKKNVSVVGTRKITPQGKIAALEFAYDAALNNCNVISGLANGVDGYAHQGCINAYFDVMDKNESIQNVGKTVAVLPGSIDSITPLNHTKLASKIIQTGGCIISEYEPKMEMAAWHFVQRNRIIAGLSSSTVVIQSPSGSGALITADFALDFNRDVFFHQAAFSDIAKEISDYTEKKLDIDFANGKISKYKRENTVKKFLLSGAPVISDYNDYCNALKEEPGLRNSIYVQRELI